MGDRIVLQWKNVYLTYEVDFKLVPVKGTFFLSEHESKTVISWIRDSDQDFLLSENYPNNCDMDVKDLKRLIRRQSPGHSYYGIYLILNDARHGPFDFYDGGSSSFIEVLDQVVNVERSKSDPSDYLITPKLRYELPNDAESKTYNFPFSVEKFGYSFRQSVFSVLTVLRSDLNLLGDETIEGYTSQSLRENEPNFENDRLRTTEHLDFAIVERRPDRILLPKVSTVCRSDPLTMEQWRKFLDSEGRVTCLDKLRSIIFKGGISPETRPIVWKYLLGYYHWEYTAFENEKLRSQKHMEYHQMKSFWKSMSADRVARFASFTKRKSFIDKDVPRTDRQTEFFHDNSRGNLTRLSDILITYGIYNIDLGYYQGMNDLLALVLCVIKEEEDAFWCFVGLMNRLESNFSNNCIAMSDQFNQVFTLVEFIDPDFGRFLESKNAKNMPFCLRWLLVQFKREFTYSDAMTLWEVIWTDCLTQNFHIFFAASVLIMHRDKIIQMDYDANSILKHVNELALCIPLEVSLNIATTYVHQLNQILNSLPKDLVEILNGPSCCTSKHVKQDQKQLCDNAFVTDDENRFTVLDDNPSSNCIDQEEVELIVPNTHVPSSSLSL